MSIVIRDYLLCSVCIVLLYSFGYTQVDADALMGVPKITTVERNAIPVATIEQGSIVYDTDELAMYQFDGTIWQKLSVDISRTIVLNRLGTGNNTLLPNATNTYFDFPLNASHTQVNTGSTFTVVSNGAIRVLTDGVYMISASLSTNNMPSGTTKYILGAFVNGGLIGYLTRGFATLPGTDWWGGSGTLMYNLQANDVVTIRYVLNNNGNALSARYVNIGITKI